MAIKLRMRTQNQTFIEQIEEELPESSVYYLLLAMLIAMAWTIYLTYYHSRVMGIIIGAVLNKFLRYLGHIKFGSFSFSVLSGKVMFRDFHIITEDYSLRIQYGWIIFRWWRPYVYKEINEDMSHSETRMSLFIDGLEFHVYNRSANYAQLEKFFGLKPTMVPECDVEEPVQNRIQVAENGIHWRDLIPVIKIDINSGRFIFGNYLLPYTLLASFEEAHLVYTTKPASTPFDMFMHVVKCKSENMKVMMVPSPNYRGTLVDEPPRNMGEGFVVMQSNDVDIYYYMDEPGLVPHEPELVEMADGEVVVRRTYPCLGIDIKCGKKTDFNYGPWVDRQREHLWKFFFPVDYQPLIPTKEPDAGQRRVYKTFETKINCTASVTFDILFTKNSVTQAIHINAQQGSYVESIIPWMIDEDGYKTKIKGQLMLLDASTSMTFRNLAELETLEFDVTIDYPITWNEYQDWKIDLTGCKATVSLIYEHMNFFKDLVEDWSSKGRPDLYSFVPYTWSLNLIIKEFELIAATNEYNWIDTSSQTPENAQIAFCGEYFDLSVQLPFTDFLPNTIAIPLVIKGETVFCRVYLPESNTSRHIILALSDNMKIVNRDGIEVDGPFGYNKVNQWRKVTQISAGWVDCWWTSNVSLSISYTYHPMPVVESSLKMWTDLEDLTTPEKEETILQPLRPGKSDSTESNKVAPENFDASTWEPDIVNVELEVAPSVLFLYGSLLVNLLHLKENYVGEDQKVYDFSDSPTDTGEADTGHVHDTGIEDDALDKFDPRAYRPFAVTVSVTLHDIQAQLVKNCNVDDVPCPSLHVERLCFEMDKSYQETKLQLLLSPCVLIARDNVVRDLDQDHLKEGYLALSGLQVRGHAMFSHEGLHLDTETLEYAWLVEVIIGEVTGKLTSPEIQNIAEFLQTFVMLVEDPENHLQNPVPFKLCQHMLPQTQCRMLPKCPFPCPSADDIKYRMVRVSVDSVNIYMVESGAAFNLKLNPVRLSTCNLHGNETRSGITAIVEHVSFRQLISCVPLRVEHGSPEVWLEAGSFSFGPINVEAAMAIPSPEIQLVQDTFLKTHDRKTKRLWFMWPLEAMGPGNHPHTLGKCGCQGGCRFFGNNKNGVAFFRSRRHRETSHAAIPQVCGDGHDPGFAQSLLHKDKLVFDVSQNIHRESPTKTSPTEFSFTRGYMSDIASPDTPGDPISKIFDSSIIGSISEHDSTSKRHSGEVSFSSDSKTQLYDPNEKLEQACKITPDVSSESGMTSKHSPDSKALGKTSLSSSNPSSPIVSGRLGSRTSFSSVNKSSSKTSLPSPISVHSTDGITRMTSTISLESQQYYSAEEDLTSSEQDSVVHFSVFDDEHSLDSTNSFIQSSPSSDKGENNNSMATTILEQTVRMNKSDTSSESSSSSTLSYESAGSVNSVEGHEEFSLVDLHNQMNQPITSSPLLLSCYSNHLSHYHCNDWVTAPPSANLSSSSSRGMKSVYSEYSLSSASHSVYGSGSTWLPHFTKVKDGFSTSVMREKEELKLPSPPPPEKGKNKFFFPSSYIPNQEDEDEELNNDDLCPNTSKTTAVIKVTGALDVLLTPLLLESMQRYIETVTPTLSKLHISSLLDRIHSQCIDRLKQQNKLKKESTKEEENVIYNINDTEDKQDNKEVSKTTSFRAFFSLPKINICVLQASIVEEVISFSMLENISDVTAVSLLAVCVDNIKCQLLTNTHSCKILPDTNTGDATSRRASAPPILTPASGHGTNKIKPELNVNEPEKEQTGPSEATREENVGILQISRIHTQLRRLVKESNFSDNIILTAIPDYRSNVLFSFNPEVIVTSPMGMPGSPRRRLSRQVSRESNDPDFIIGFIMFECGLEDVSVTAVRRLGYKADSDLQLQQKMDNIEQTLQDLQETTKEQIEQQTDPSTSPTDDPLPHSSPSAHHSSLSMSSSWNSRVSFKSDESDIIPLEINIEPLKGDASNGRLDLKTIWLNFAAPPPISIKKKVDFTRMDWNLLSTATPSINAWMNPSDRAMVAVRNLVRVLTHRTSSVVACIMTEALEVQGIHVCNKTKFGKATNLSKTLQEEPSCQLLTVLRKYLRKYGTSSVEQAVSSETIPNLITMQKGILALTRQWKNVLYMPYLSELNFKNKKNVRPYNVTFALPGDEESTDIYIDDGEAIIDQFDVVDEKTSLLQAEGGSVHKFGSNPSLANKAFSQPDASHDGISSVSTASIRHKKIPSILTKKGAKGGLPHILSCVDSPERKPHVSAPLPTLLMTRNESTQSFASVPESLCSSEPGIAPTPPPTPMRQMGPKQSILKNRYDKSEDLYQWMAKQQEDLKMPLDEDSNYGKAHEGWLLGSSWSQDESRTDVNEDNVTMATSIMQLADAQMLFKPLLQSLGLHVEGVRPSAMMKKFGGHLLLQGHLEVLKVQIAESEDSKSRGKSKSKGKGKRFRLNINASTPAFQCEGFGINICMKDVIDFGAKESFMPEKGKSNPWKFAMHKLEAKPTTLQVNFLINCQRITQHVDMSLLRLVHQFVTMVDNIKDTQVELKKRRPSLLGEWTKTHRKQESKDSTSSADTQQSDLSKQEHQAEVTLSTPTHSTRSETPSDAGDKTLTHSKNTPSFKLPMENIRPERLSFSSIKKPHLRFARDKNKKDSTPGQQSEILTPPQSLNLSDTVTIDMVDTSSPALAEKTIVDEIKESTPRCWRHLYHLLELYSTMPETKTVLRKPGIQKLLPVIEEEPEKDGTSKRETTPCEDVTDDGEVKARVDMVADEESRLGDHPPLAQTSFIRTRFKQSIYIGESIPLVVYGIAKVERVQMLAVLSGLKLEAELRKVHASGTYKEKVKGFIHRKSAESSFTAHVGHTMIVLLEGVPPNMQTVVTVNIGKSQALHTTVMRRSKEHNSALASVGVIDVDIPQHPVVLHGMMTRSSKKLTSTLQEFRRPLSRIGKVQDIMEQISGEAIRNEKKLDEKLNRSKRLEKDKPVALHIHFKAVLQGFTIGASILPSLKAQHKTGCITVAGMTGKKARFTVVLPKHTLSFKSKVTTTETSIPSSASIEMPPIHIYADYRTYKTGGPVSDTLTEGLVLKEGSYLNAVAEVGMLEHSLTTDLLNHLVFVQKVFMKEVNEVVQKVSGSDQPVHLWADDQSTTAPPTPRKPLLYSFSVRFKGIQVTATTPTSNAVRLETGEIELEMSNRVQMASRELYPDIEYEDNQKVFIRAQIDLNVSLGQLLKNPVFEEAEPEFQTMAFFKTKIGVRNAIQDEMIPGVATEQEALLITVSRPIVLAQPLAFDKAVLVWLNYKNAYEYWTEQRMALNNEVQTATRQVFDRLPQFAPAAGPTLSTLFLQLTVDDMGICVPLESTLYQKSSKLAESEPGAALVLTVESTQISACSSGSLVSKGRFKSFCLRFADDFETSLDDWKPNTKEEPIMNVMVVKAGTYEVCSRTDNKQASDPKSNAKWILNVQWEMQGLDVHFDTDIGKRLSALGHTLTALAGETTEEDEYNVMDDDDDPVDETDNEATDTETTLTSRRTSLVSDILPDIVFTTDMDPKERVRQIEREMNEQAKIVQDLRDLGASQSTIEAERKKLEELQALVFRDFRRDVLNKIKKQGERASAIKDKLGIGIRPAHVRSRSYGGHHGRRHDSDSSSGRVLSKTLDNRHNRIRPISADVPFYNKSHVQFGSTYPPPSSAEARSMSLDVDLFDETNEEQLTQTLSLQDIMGSDSDVSLTSSNITDSEESLSRRNTRNSSKNFNRARSTTLESSHSIPGKTTSEPSIDFELDIKVFIDSGKCVLYPKEAKEEEVKKQLKREKSGGLGEANLTKIKRHDSSPSLSSGKKAQQQILTTQGETTVFFLPSVDVKVHYNSKTTSDLVWGAGGGSSFDISRGYSTETPTPSVETPLKTPQWNYYDASTPTTQDIPTIVEPTDNTNPQPGSKRGTMKRANLYAWLSLNTLPEEMIISPCLLDFLEQALEPLPISQPTAHKKVDVMGSVLNMELDASHGSLTSPVGLASFPVDVVVFIRVERSMIRFNCIPISRVECVLNVPSLELVFSTKKADVEVPFSEGTPPSRAKVPKRGGDKTTGGASATGTRGRLGSTLSDNSLGTHSGGLSVTGTLSNFSLYIFHPYGGGQRRMGQTASPSYSKRGLGSIHETSSSSSGLIELQRKDSLSLNVEFIKVNISRSRKMDFRSGDNITVTKLDPQQKCNMVRFSAVCDIGAASFKYDMRRLSEILSLPKAWYRRNLARRLFLGDDSFGQVPGDEFDPPYDHLNGDTNSRPPFYSQTSVSFPSLVINDGNISYTQKRDHRRAASSGDKLLITPEFQNEIAQTKIRNKAKGTSIHHQRSPTEASTETYQSPNTGRSSLRNRTKQYFTPELPRQRHTSAQTSVTSSWETLVLFAVNLSRLELDVNMSNVMGNTMWTTKEVKSQGRLSIDSSGHKNLKITAGLGGSSFESRGGVIGGAIDLQGVHGLFQVKEDPDLGHDPDHRAGLTLEALEGRVDYMGSSVLMTRLNNLDLLLRDDWHVERETGLDTPVATKRSAYLFVNGDLSWDQFHIMISRSTTPDLIKLVSKLEEFFTQQLTSSKRVLSAFGPLTSKPNTQRHSKLADDLLAELRHHRHWQGALEHLVGCRFSMLSQILPEEGMVLGGSVTLKGEHLCLASFHGINFRSKSWALFSIRQPYISFSTEAQKTENDNTHIVQDLSFIVGGAKAPDNNGQHMVTICKLSRGHYVPQQFTSVQEWFAYAFATNEIKELDTFPVIIKDRCRPESPPEHRKTRKSQVYNHETEIIFGMPSMTLNLKTSHLQGKNVPVAEDAPPVVECTFVTEFYDHINVAMDAEVILFLHDLVLSYIKEKDKGARMSYGHSSRSPKSPDMEKKKIPDPTAALKQDWRDFRCKAWQLEPTVRLLHWASRQIDPVGVDYVLQKLGFTHARVTIPKWVQRGFMDPVDKVLSVLVDKLIVSLQDPPDADEVD